MQHTPDNLDARMEALKAIPPLLPQFLKKRRAGLPAVREIAAELGIEPPLLFTLVRLHELQGGYGGKPVSHAQILAREPYTTIDVTREPIRELTARGLVGEDPSGYISLKPRSWEAIDRLHAAGRDYVAAQEPLTPEVLASLARELERTDGALLDDPLLGPRPGSHFAESRALAYHTDQRSMVRIEQAVFDLWMARDDAHIHSWRATDLSGPAVAILSVLWLGEANSVPDLVKALASSQDASSVESNLLYLVENEYVARRGDAELSMTPAGALLREDIERETDRVYFAPWPQTLEEAQWLRDTLAALVSNLNPAFTAVRKQ